MDTNAVKLHVYEGQDPYIHMSFHPEDEERVFACLEQLTYRGFRMWHNDGIPPGTDADEIIATHIEQCELFVAFISKAYLASLDLVDELNYSRDTNKAYLLVYVEDVPLPAGLDMRFKRAQSINAFEMNDTEVAQRFLGIAGAEQFYGIADATLKSKAERIFAKLEKLYPEHKVFALDAIGKELSKGLSEMYVQAGYPSVDRLLLDYGFSHVSTDEARTLRSSVVYQPGFEPELVKSHIDYMISTLRESYPDGHINESLAKSHKSIHRSLLGISIWLGYNSVTDMLNAYGFTAVEAEVGRKAIDHVKIIEELKQRHRGPNKPRSMSELRLANPDLSASLKTLSNNAPTLLGMTLLQYLKSIGLIVAPYKEEQTTMAAMKRVRILEGIKEYYYAHDMAGALDKDMEAVEQLILKQNARGTVYVSGCTLDGDQITIPYGIDAIGKEAFSGQSELFKLTLSPTVKEIGAGAFMDCSALEYLVLPEGVERIDDHAFENCTALKKVTLPASLKYVGNNAFSGCENLDEVIVGNPRANIQSDAFDGCIFDLESLQDENASPAEYFELQLAKKNTAKIVAYTGDEEVVVVPAMIAGHPIVSIEKGCFKGNESIREVYINDQITALNGDVFKDCVNLEKVHLSETLTKLTSAAFAGCKALAEINIPDCMEEVPRGLFKDSPLTTLYIGRQVKKLAPDAFYKGEMDFTTGIYLKKKTLERLIVDVRNEAFSADGTLLLSKDGTVLLAELGDPVHAVIPEGVVEIQAQAYEKLGLLTAVSFPSTLKKIGEKAFAGTLLTALDIPGNVEEIGMQAFSYCRSLTRLDLYDGLRFIGTQAFEGCPIQTVFIPATVESLGSDSFLAISTYQGSIRQKFQVDSANQHVFVDGIALYQQKVDGLYLVKAYHEDLRSQLGEEKEPMSYSVAQGTTHISPHAFARCNNMTAIELPDSLCVIDDMAFWDCSKLTTIHIPPKCTKVSPKAFFGTAVQLI